MILTSPHWHETVWCGCGKHLALQWKEAIIDRQKKFPERIINRSWTMVTFLFADYRAFFPPQRVYLRDNWANTFFKINSCRYTVELNSNRWNILCLETYLSWKYMGCWGFFSETFPEMSLGEYIAYLKKNFCALLLVVSLKEKTLSMRLKSEKHQATMAKGLNHKRYTVSTCMWSSTTCYHRPNKQRPVRN